MGNGQREKAKRTAKGQMDKRETGKGQRAKGEIKGLRGGKEKAKCEGGKSEWKGQRMKCEKPKGIGRRVIGKRKWVARKRVERDRKTEN